MAAQRPSFAVKDEREAERVRQRGYGRYAGVYDIPASKPVDGAIRNAGMSCDGDYASAVNIDRPQKLLDYVRLQLGPFHFLASFSLVEKSGVRAAPGVGMSPDPLWRSAP
jgi:hypothetical protein